MKQHQIKCVERVYQQEINGAVEELHTDQLYARVKEAERLINQAVEIMTAEQLSQWDGVRFWLEAPISRR